jgi:hypothetical protein
MTFTPLNLSPSRSHSNELCTLYEPNILLSCCRSTHSIIIRVMSGAEVVTALFSGGMSSSSPLHHFLNLFQRFAAPQQIPLEPPHTNPDTKGKAKPPIAALWRREKSEPATTDPIEACQAAAALPVKN